MSSMIKDFFEYGIREDVEIWSRAESLPLFLACGRIQDLKIDVDFWREIGQSFAQGHERRR